jgi:hypothetical protein
VRRVEIEEARTQEALYFYEQTVLTAFREVEDALAEVRTYRVQLSAVENQQKAAKNANMLSNERYDKGVSSYLEVLETERSLFNVQLQLSELQQLYLNAYVNLYKALGGGWITKEEMAAYLLAQQQAAGASPQAEGFIYQIKVQGRLDKESRERLSDMTFKEDDSTDPPVTLLEGRFADQAALSEILGYLTEKDLPLLSVERLEEE